MVNQNLVGSFPDDVSAYNRLGRAHMELGEFTRAWEAYSRAIELDPYNSIARKNLDRLSRLQEAGMAVSDGSRAKWEVFRPYGERAPKARRVPIAMTTSFFSGRSRKSEPSVCDASASRRRGRTVDAVGRIVAIGRLPARQSYDLMTKTPNSDTLIIAKKTGICQRKIRFYRTGRRRKYLAPATTNAARPAEVRPL